jgi:putative transposase
MIDRNHDLPIVRQAKALNISRGSIYYKSRPVSAEDLALMRRIDELHLEYPFAGSGPKLRDNLNRLSLGRARALLSSSTARRFGPVEIDKRSDNERGSRRNLKLM